jgi:cob(I)alamin adenosyltransferase
MSSAAALASDPENKNARIILPEEDCFKVLEGEIDKMEESLTPLKNFLLPGGSIPVSHCHIARCVCRRAERAVLRLSTTEKTPEIVVKFLNRLSDFLFVLSRKISSELNNEEVKWVV